MKEREREHENIYREKTHTQKKELAQICIP